jgi:penicillin-binding protein 2
MWRAVCWLGLCCLLVLTACQPVASNPTATAEPTDTPQPRFEGPLPDEVGYGFLQAWAQGDYGAMYALLSPAAQASTSQERFVLTYSQIAEEASLVRVEPQILSALQEGQTAQVRFVTAFESSLVGAFERQNQMTLVYDGGRWGVEWAPSLIFPQLAPGGLVQMTLEGPPRGNIYDREGHGLAVAGTWVEVGVVPGQIEDETTLLNQLSLILNRPPAELQAEYADAVATWYVPLGRISSEAAQAHYPTLASLAGVQTRDLYRRIYPQPDVAPHVLGTMSHIPPEELDTWRAQGYSGDELVGRTGLERWGEELLSGRPRARLVILNAAGQQVDVLGQREGVLSTSLHTTFDIDFQLAVQEILGTQLGAIAVLEVDTGRVLALATYPRFDPNLFATGIAGAQWTQLQSDSRRPLVNRASQGTYPAGSVFKVVTIAAGMEQGGLQADSTFTCNGTWTGLGPELPKTCWLRSGHGRIPLNYALTVSCDITFYQVGLLLNGIDQNLLPEFGRGFGLGAPTGLGIEEAAGQMPDPEWYLQHYGWSWLPGDSVNLAIGQGDLLVTPIQIARLMAAVGNGGTLYQPQVVQQVGDELEHPQQVYEPVVVGSLPVSANTLGVIQAALHEVTANPAGTAYRAFEGLELPVAGKTGTAESGQEKPHAWFAGYAPADNPEIAIAVLVEHSGEGSTFAAPLLRKVVETYFGIATAEEATPEPSEATATPAP